MARKPTRGRGSNQYADKAPTSALDTEALNARVRKMKSLTQISRPSGAVATADLRNASTAALTSHLTSSYDDQIKLFLKGNATPAQMEEKVKLVAAFEDAILTRHNDAYGQALSEGARFVKQAKYSPEIREAIKSPEAPERVLLDGYARILKDAIDAPGEKLTLEELPEILDRLNRASILRERGEQWREERKGEPTLSSQFAATSVFSFRDPENPHLQRQLQVLRTQLNERGVSKIDI